MPVHSRYPPIKIPSVDLWAFNFDNAAREFPDNHAVYVDTAANKKHTFRGVQTAAEEFGKGLMDNWGWQKGDLLVLITPNSANIASVVFGALYAGGVICPLSNVLTVGELVQSLKASGAKAIVTHTECLDAAKQAAKIVAIPEDRILLVDEAGSRGDVRHFSDLRSSSQGLERPKIDPAQDLAFLVYSSGTTGLPKGVMLTHQNMVANTMQSDVLGEEFTHWKRDRSLGFLPMYHIYGIAALILLPLYKGITTYIMQRFDLKVFCNIVHKDRITFAYIVPPVALALAKSPVVDEYDLTSLRMLHSSAAPTAKDIIEAIYRRFEVPTRQGYGLSEASPGVCSQTAESWNKPIGSSGRLAPSMSLKIVQDGKEMPHGKEGELWIRGPNIFKGYYNNPTATAEAVDADGWYRTGDIGYVDEHDNIFITDRLKELIKYNGFQVPPAQLEGVLIAHPAVADVAVVGVYSAERATELPRAYIVLAEGYKGDEEMERSIHEWFDKQVAAYKRLRGGIRFVESVPKSNAGKLLRRVLVEQARQENKPLLKARM
ncbi:hypothetical protein OPT61_g1804 [Boeremia exigua]|uniref:Uncharacterized protein n=1 Tax=Boeremia exigua TaxID=749465 RepID=A0ACC2IP64_9PLEO|nr:hypothetical protein OPT61_g1804 [Boeremia exigua]